MLTTRGAPLRAICLAGAMMAAGAAMAAPVTFRAADGVTVHADLERAGGDGRPMIVLFHQAGGNHHEYDPIVPELLRMGFDTLAVDQRAGGRAWGHRNDTAAGVSGRADYLDAYADMEAALAWAAAKGAGRPGAIVWGSSYSAALVFRLAAEHPGDVTKVLAFSPGEYFGEPAYVRGFAARVGVPVFVTSASDAGEVAAGKAIAAKVGSGRATQFVPRVGSHGSSTLRADTNPDGAPAIWAAVAAFLKE